MATNVTVGTNSPGNEELSDFRVANVCTGTIAGVLGGIAGAWAMDAFVADWNRRREGRPASWGLLLGPVYRDGDLDVKIASVVGARLARRRLNCTQRKLAGKAVHYAAGAIMGGVYGAFGEAFPQIRTGAGATFGLAVWLLAEEIAVSVLRLAPAADGVAAEDHLEAAAAHVVYGVATELVRRRAKRSR